MRSQLVFDHRWCQVRQDTVTLPNGKIIDDYYITIRPEIALIFAITEQQELILVRQYKHGAGEILLELPGGMFDPHEGGESAAIRELLEETGYLASHLIKLTTLYDNPTKDTNQVHLFLAENVRYVSPPQPEITEEIEVILLPIAQVMQSVIAGKICVAGSVAGIILGLEHLKIK